MKSARSLVFIIVIAVAALLGSCATTPQKNNGEVDQTTKKIIPEKKVLQTSINYSLVGPEQEGTELTVTGSLKVGADGTYILTTNPESKSRVTFVLNDSNGVLATYAPQDGSTITITGILTDASATWTKKMNATAIK